MKLTMGRLKSIIVLVLTAHLLVAINAQKQEEDNTCHVYDLEPGRVLQCTDKELHQVFFESNVPNGASCDIICPNKPVKTIAYCEQGTWNKNYLTYCRSVVSSIKKRPKRWFWIFKFVVSLFISSFGSSGSRRDNNPPRLICPPNQNVTAVKLQTWQIVNWTEPVASDDRDGRIRATRNGKSSGSYFSSGDTTVGYYARDTSENMARCTFVITVTVVRCPWLSPLENGYFVCHPSDDARYGATCRFGCHPGYDLIGNQVLECLFSGKWDYLAPICKKKTCPLLLPSILPMNYTCTDGNKFRSICTYFCTRGYDITPGMSRVRVCTAYGKWRGSEPTCRDIEPPTIIGCSNTVYAYADRNTTSGFITWNEPTATDNHDSSVEVVKEGNISSGDKISAGSYKLIYKAVDSTGNKAQICKTHIILKVLTCPVVYATPFLQVTCPWGTKYGGQCEFKCDPGSERNGSKIIVCEKSESGAYGYWTGGETQTYCKVTQKCAQEPNIPQNGALACDNWLGGKVCQMLCKTGYDVKVGYKSVDMLVCGNNGQWLPTGSLPLPDCSRSFLAARGILRMSISYYYTGHCTDSDVQKEIKEKFIENLSKSAYRDVCFVYATDCNVENVQVKCGLSLRKKRSDSNLLRVDFDIAANFENESFVDSFAKFRSHQTDMSLKIKDFQISRSLDFNTSDGRLMEATAVDNYDLKLECPDNTIPSYKTTSCVECAAGTFYDNNTETCQMCPKGQYQPDAGKTQCRSCPHGQTTKTKGSQQLAQCEGGCYPGSWSADGTPECSLCAVGSYSDVYGASECILCPGSTSTAEEGTDSVAKCNDFDLGLTESDSETSTNFTVSGDENASISFWLQMDDYVNGSFDVEIINTEERTIAFYMSLGSKTFLGKDGEKKKTPFTLTTPRWQLYFIGMNNQSSELYVNGILNTKMDMTFKLSGNLTMSLRGKGTITKLNIWTNTITTFTNILRKVQNCSAADTGSVFSWKTLESNTNDKIYKQIPSECDDENNCLLDSCLNGTCTDLNGGYECQCDFGFTGNNCEENIDDCDDHACENNATCVDGAANYTCDCLYGYKGELCEIAMVDGSWGEWDEWSSCSVTCGNGTQQRWRVCNDPAPDSGGLECPDNSTDSRLCIQDGCPKCNTLERHEKVEWACTNDTENMNCTIECADGYDFDHEIKPYYMCGKDTFYLWDFQTDDNPEGKMPMCIKIENSEKLQVFYQATYKDLECDSLEMYEEARIRVPEVVQQEVNRIDCVSLGICRVEKVDIIDCSKRQKRSITTTTAGINVSLSCEPALYDTETCYKMLYSALNGIHGLTVNQSFDVDIRDITYELNSSSPQAFSSVQCSSGMVPVRYYCIPCSRGRYLKNDECVKCEYGTYQDKTGKAYCKKCPDHTTTPGRESRAITECSVKLDENEVNDYVVVLGCIIGGSLFIVAAISIVVLRRCLKKSETKKDGKLFTPSKNKIGLADSKNTTGRKCAANSSTSEGKFRDNFSRRMSSTDTHKIHKESSVHDVHYKAYDKDDQIDIIDL